MRVAVRGPVFVASPITDSKSRQRHRFTYSMARTMPKISATVRITLGLIGLLASLLLIVAILGLFPNRCEDITRGRIRLCESVAVHFSAMAEKNDIDAMRKCLQFVAGRNRDLLSMAVRRDDGSVLIEVGDHTANWKTGKLQRSSDAEIWVELFASGKPWGQIEMRFEPVSGTGWLSRFNRPGLYHGLVVVGLCMGVYYAYLTAVLRQLNPSKVIPNRVREALDTLAEGLVILDQQERIVLANRAIEESTGTSFEELIGASIAKLQLVNRDESPTDSTPWAAAIRSGQAVTGQLYGLEGTDRKERIFSVSASPILDESGARRGVLASFEDVTPLEQKKRELKTMVDYLRASSEEIRRQNRELEHLATRDPLTGALNRRSFFERFEAEWKSCERYDHDLSVAMVDVDHFKSVNDKHGHSMGDEVLRQVAACLQKAVRETDIVCRYGGEEFAILMPNTNLERAEICAERCRLAISKLEFGNFSVTASMGVSALTEGPNSPQELLDQADKCLYVAKRNGRNQVIRYDQVPMGLVVEESKIARTKEEDVDPFERVAVPFHAVTALITALAYRDHTTAAHSRRVADLCIATAEGLLSLSDCYTLEVAALLHDIGKIGVPDSILLKPGPLTPDEWDVMRRNETIGIEIIRTSFASPTLSAIVENYQTHYGAVARRGQPSGNRIPIGARILAIADAYDAMVSDRVYRKGRSRKEAFAELRQCAGQQFDPELVERFIAIVQIHEAETVDSNVSKETALMIGVQIERLSRALDQHDLETLDAMARRLFATSSKYGAASIAHKASDLTKILDSDRDLHAIIQTAGELLDLCRATQASFLKQPDVLESNSLSPPTKL
jgi:diguanylate cyclase (GGDEF)-like protein/PAS domain S-box-containing protein